MQTRSMAHTAPIMPEAPRAPAAAPVEHNHQQVQTSVKRLYSWVLGKKPEAGQYEEYSRNTRSFQAMQTAGIEFPEDDESDVDYLPPEDLQDEAEELVDRINERDGDRVDQEYFLQKPSWVSRIWSYKAPILAAFVTMVVFASYFTGPSLEDIQKLGAHEGKLAALNNITKVTDVMEEYLPTQATALIEGQMKEFVMSITELFKKVWLSGRFD